MERQRSWRYVGSRPPEPQTKLRGSPHTTLEFAVAIVLCAAVVAAMWWFS